MNGKLPATVALDMQHLVHEARDLDLEIVVALGWGTRLVQAHHQCPRDPEVHLPDHGSGQDVRVVCRIRWGSIFSDQSRILGSNEERHRTSRRRERRLRGRVDGLQDLATPRKTELLGRRCQHRPVQDIAKPQNTRHRLRGRPPQESPRGPPDELGLPRRSRRDHQVDTPRRNRG